MYFKQEDATGVQAPVTATTFERRSAEGLGPNGTAPLSQTVSVCISVSSSINILLCRPRGSPGNDCGPAAGSAAVAAPEAVGEEGGACGAPPQRDQTGRGLRGRSLPGPISVACEVFAALFVTFTTRCRYHGLSTRGPPHPPQLAPQGSSPKSDWLLVIIHLMLCFLLGNKIKKGAVTMLYSSPKNKQEQ